MATETYNISTDLTNGIKNHILVEQINASSIVPVCTRVPSDGITCVCHFDAILSVSERTTLDAVITAHQGTLINEELVILESGDKIKAKFGKECMTPTSPIEIKEIEHFGNMNVILLINLGTADITLKHGTGNILCKGSDRVIPPLSCVSLIYIPAISKWLLLGWY